MPASPVRRLVLPAVLAVLLLPVPAWAAEGRSAFVVLDRGRGAAARAEPDADVALDLVRALAERGTEVVLLAATAGEEGTQKLLAPSATRAGLAPLSTPEALAASGTTDARGALRTVLVGATGRRAIDVYLVGPFGAPGEGFTKGAVRSLEKAVEEWNAAAGPDSRVLPIGVAPAARATLEGVRGLVASGWVVTAFEEPSVRPAPFSPLAPPEEAPLTAQVSVAARLVPVGEPSGEAVLLEVSTDVAEDVVAVRAADSLTLAQVRRDARNGRNATVSFRAGPAPDLVWLCDVPGPLAFRWETLRPDARLEALGAGSAVLFEAVDAQADATVVRSFRLLRSRAGPAPAWRAAGEALPEGMRFSVGEEVGGSPDVAESELRLEFQARPATPIDARGTLLLQADGMPEALRVPWVVRVRPGRVALRMDDATLALPRAAADAAVALRIEAQDANAPAEVGLVLDAPPDAAAWLRGVLHLPLGRTAVLPIGEPVAAPVGAPLGLALEATADAPGDVAWPLALTVGLAATPGVQVEGEARLAVRQRRPRLVLDDPPPLLRVTGGRLVVVRPLRLRLDADGGDGTWLLDLLARTPTVVGPPGARDAWTVVSREPGRWEATTEGPWSGRSARVFDDARAALPVAIAWSAGAAPEGVAVPVEIPARWGVRGWVFVALAALALGLGLAAFLLMRVPRVGGTLLYALRDQEGVVGRLDLTPVGRRRAVVTADPRGRLTLDGDGEPLVRLLPTRVGGVLEVAGEGPVGERRLLVEGLALTVGRHRLRYLSGAPGPGATSAEEVPDLLGPEFDLASGRIEALGDETDATGEGPSGV